MVKAQREESSIGEKLRKMFGATIKPVKARYEISDPTPIAPPLGFKRTPSLAEQIRDMVRSQALADAAERSGMETFEESEDFDIPDDPMDPITPYENDFDTPVSELKRRQQEDLEKLKRGGDPLPSDAIPRRQGKPQSREDAAAAPLEPGSGGGEVDHGED